MRSHEKYNIPGTYCSKFLGPKTKRVRKQLWFLVSFPPFLWNFEIRILLASIVPCFPSPMYMYLYGAGTPTYVRAPTWQRMPEWSSVPVKPYNKFFSTATLTLYGFFRPEATVPFADNFFRRSPVKSTTVVQAEVFISTVTLLCKQLQLLPHFARTQEFSGSANTSFATSTRHRKRSYC